MRKPFYTSAAIRDLEEILAFIAQDKFHRFVSNRLEILRVLPGERNITSL